MKPPGPLLASGRDSEIFEYGAGLVLRRSRDGRSIAHEARTMAYLAQQGYPVPAIEEVSEDGTCIVMERIEGPSMVGAISRSPWKVRHYGGLLADLHLWLHSLTVPDFVAPSPFGRGQSILHLDLHPLNVMIGPRGPFVIDWANAKAGDPEIDVAVAWVLMSAGEIPGGRAMARVLGVGRSLLVRSFTSRFDREAVRKRMAQVVEWKVKDPHMSEGEIQAMRRVAGRSVRSPR